MPNLKNVLQIVVEIDGGGQATRTQTVLHQNRLFLFCLPSQTAHLYFVEKKIANLA